MNQIQRYLYKINLKGENVKHERVAYSFHTGKVTSMDCCISKPLLATCGEDKSIRVWNYFDNTLEAVRYFDEPPTCISFHPNGLYLAAVFPSGLKLLVILKDEIKPYWEHNVMDSKSVSFFN